MTWWKEKAWPWLRKWGALILGIIAVIFGAGWLYKTYKGRLGKVKDELAIAEATKEIGKLRATRIEVAARVGEKDEAMGVIDHKLKENKRIIIEAHEGGENLSDEEVLEEFAHLGI